MGMGDESIPYAPKHKTVRCAVSGYAFADCLLRECHHPGVIRHYGDGSGNVCVSIYVCRKCRFKVTYPYFGGLGCSYEFKLQPEET